MKEKANVDAESTTKATAVATTAATAVATTAATAAATTVAIAAATAVATTVATTAATTTKVMQKPARAKKRTRILGLLLAVMLALGMAACGDGGSSEPSGPRTLTDPSGAQITVPEEINTVAVLAPSLAETVVALGFGDKIEAYDTSSVGLEGLKEDALVLDLSAPDMEQLVNLKPDVLLVTNMTLYDQENPYQSLIDLGVCVACVPTSDSIADIESDIAFVASVFEAEEKGQEIIDGMQEEIDRIAAVGKTITEKKTVYFEISAAPYLYSFGKGVFLNEMLELIGAENILAGESGWLGVTEESVVSADPDVILTNVNYIEDPVGEIKSRPGWEAVTAVKNGAVYSIDNMASSVPDHHIIKALQEMAAAVYPEYYGN